MRLDGPVHVSWGMGERRRPVVVRSPWRVRVWTFERRMAFLPGGFWEEEELPPYARAGEDKRERMRRREVIVRERIMVVVVDIETV